MINAMTRDLERALKAKKFPFEVRYDSDRFGLAPNRTCVIVQRDTEVNDEFSFVQGVQRNTRRLGAREIAARVSVFAKSSVSGARRSDHECLSDQITDGIHCALMNWGVSKRMPVSFKSGRFLTPDEFEGSAFSGWTGTVYTIALTVMRGVIDSDFHGEGLLEVTLDDVTTTTA